MPEERVDHAEESRGTVDSKTCNWCGETKPITEFNRNRGMPDGRVKQCKPCRNAANLKSKAKSPEKQKANVRRWRKRNPGWLREKERKYRERNPEKAAARTAVHNALLRGDPTASPTFPGVLRVRTEKPE